MDLLRVNNQKIHGTSDGIKQQRILGNGCSRCTTRQRSTTLPLAFHALDILDAVWHVHAHATPANEPRVSLESLQPVQVRGTACTPHTLAIATPPYFGFPLCTGDVLQV